MATFLQNNKFIFFSVSFVVVGTFWAMLVFLNGSGPIWERGRIDVSDTLNYDK